MTNIKHGAALLLTLCLIVSMTSCSRLQPPASEPETEAVTAQPTEPPEEDKLDKLLGSMTIEEKVGQMFLVRCPDVDAAQYITDYHLGGFILFGRDFAEKTTEQVSHDIQSYQKSSVKVPMLIAVDEEGGDVVRVSDNPNLYSEAFPSPKTVFENGGWEAVDATENEKAQLLLSLGVNVNMAPVCDVTVNEDSFMYSRSFSGDVDEVNTFVTKTVNICKEKRLGTVLKHFPGYGDNDDTHEGVAVDFRTLDSFRKTDFLPFKAGIEAGADCVLVSHNLVVCMDDDKPASLSPKVHEILRHELDFNGVIITDDLAMEGVAHYADEGSVAVEAVKCGNDLLCCSDVETQYPAVLAAVQSGEITEEQVDLSVRRVLQWKRHLGLIS